MEKQALLEQAKQLVLLQPGLSITDTAEGLTISGTYLLNSSYNDIPLYDEYQVKIIVPWEFPTAIPSIWEVGGKVPRESTFGHFLDNGELCRNRQTSGRKKRPPPQRPGFEMAVRDSIRF